MANYRLTVKGTVPGEEFNFGIHATGAAGGAAAAVAALVTALTAAWNDATDGWKQVFSTDVSVVAVHAAELAPITQRQVDARETGLVLVGTSAGDMLPHECAVAVTTRGATANRKDRGRFYLPPVAVTVISNGRLILAQRDHIAQGAAILVNQLQGLAFNPVILHPDDTTTLITGVDVGDVIDVQKRRRNKLLEARVTIGV